MRRRQGAIVLSTHAGIVLDRIVVGLIMFGVNFWAAWRRRDPLRGYAHPRWLLVLAVLAWVLTIWLGWLSLSGLQALWSA